MKRIPIFLLCIFLLCTGAAGVESVCDDAVSLSAPSALLMEQSTGTVLYEKNAYEHLSPASVTKVMTMLLVAEAIDGGTLSLADTVTASAAAAGMGGSQIWLEEGEQMSVGEMLKCVAVVSANDCCVALAEHLSGSEAAFVSKMNARAAELGMEDTHFTSCSGLSDSDEHYTCARDIAVMSRELLKHDLIRDYTSIWMDSIRDGAFGLNNTNKLIYYYPGATGLKTGFTGKAMYCLSASAERDGVEYIAVVLHAPSSAERFADAKALLNYAFANYATCSLRSPDVLPPIAVKMGNSDSVQPTYTGPEKALISKQGGDISYEVNLPDEVMAPVEKGMQIGTLTVSRGDEVICEVPLVSDCDIGRADFGRIFVNLAESFMGLC